MTYTSILHISSSFSEGGAARAAYRVHQALVSYGYLYQKISYFRSIQGNSDDLSIMSGRAFRTSKYQSRLLRIATGLERSLSFKSKNSFNTLCHYPTGLGKEVKSCFSNIDIVTLHFISDMTLSLSEISSIDKPIVWRLPDQWAFSGSIHYQEIDPNEKLISLEHPRFKSDYRDRPLFNWSSGLDIDQLTFKRKQRFFNKKMFFVAPTAWMKNCLESSTLFSSAECRVIPTPIDTNVWRPHSKQYACKELGLDSSITYIMFGAVNALEDPRKGSELLMKSLVLLADKLSSSDYEVLVFGSETKDSYKLPFVTHFFGEIWDDCKLRLLYSCADLFVLPSLLDNLPGTGIEAHAMGVPVVAFNTGGLSDIVTHHITGALAEPFSAISLASEMHWCLSDQSRLRILGGNARDKAVCLWEPRRIAQEYSNFYDYISEYIHDAC